MPCIVILKRLPDSSKSRSVFDSGERKPTQSAGSLPTDCLKEDPLGQLESLEKSHGRLQSRKARFFSFSPYHWIPDGTIVGYCLLCGWRKVEGLKPNGSLRRFLIMLQTSCFRSMEFRQEYGNNSTALAD